MILTPSNPSAMLIKVRFRLSNRTRNRLLINMADGFDAVKIIDGSGHLFGRLAAIVAKQTLNGNKVVVVRTEGLVISGNFYRNKLKIMEYLRKRHLTKPSRGPFHGRSPSKMFKHVIRGMLPHKTDRGQSAFNSLKAFEGIPAPYDKMRRVIVPSAFKQIKLKPNRKFAPVGRLAAETGWKYQDVVANLEAKRQANAQTYWDNKQKAKAVRAKAIENVKSKTAELDAQLAEL